MYIRTGCCSLDYTTRRYDLDGNILWSANYFERQPEGYYSGKYVTTQAVDADQVYVGGMRMTNSGGHSWSVVCFDIVTGEFVWDYDLGEDCLKINIDSVGNIVCMVRTSSNWYVGSGGETQVFKVLDQSGSLVRSVSFAQQQLPAIGSPTRPYAKSFDFVINEDDDYHIIGRFNGLTGNYINAPMYKWLAPQSGTPTMSIYLYGTMVAKNINRVNGRDYICAYDQFYPNLAYGSILQGKAQAAPPVSALDFDLVMPLSLTDETVTTTSIAAAGTDQATATVMTVGKNYSPITSTGGLRLPSAAVGDRIEIYYTPGQAYTAVSGVTVYPPSGGTLDTIIGSVGRQMYKRDVYICSGGSVWRSQQSFLASQHINVDSSGNIVTGGDMINPVLSVGAKSAMTCKYDSSGNPLWTKNVGSRCVVTDSNDRVYTSGPQVSPSANYVTVSCRDSSGAYVWGHYHMGSQVAEGYPSPMINMDPDGLHVIVSGSGDGRSLKGPATKAQDAHFRPDPDPDMAIGRTATGSANGVGSDYTVGFSGGASAEYTLLLAVIANESGATASISGGSDWTQFTDRTSLFSAWYKLCGASEPSTYTIAYSGGSASDGSACSIVEVLHCSPTNPESVGALSNTDTPPPTTSTSASTCVAVLVADSVGGSAPHFDVAPTGFTLQGHVDDFSVTTRDTKTAAIATKLNVGIGTVTPGPWGNPDSTNSYHWTVRLKKY